MGETGETLATPLELHPTQLGIDIIDTRHKAFSNLRERAYTTINPFTFEEVRKLGFGPDKGDRPESCLFYRINGGPSKIPSIQGANYTFNPEQGQRLAEHLEELVKQGYDLASENGDTFVRYDYFSEDVGISERETVQVQEYVYANRNNPNLRIIKTIYSPGVSVIDTGAESAQEKKISASIPTAGSEVWRIVREVSTEDGNFSRPKSSAVEAYKLGLTKKRLMYPEPPREKSRWIREGDPIIAPAGGGKGTGRRKGRRRIA